MAFGLMLVMEFTAAAAPAGALSVTDVEKHWARESLLMWLDKGLAKGFEDGRFYPDRSVSRAEFVAFANRLFGNVEQADIRFADVSSGKWYATEISRAVAAGYISGYADMTFRPERPISRQEAAVIVARMLGLEMSGSETLKDFSDHAAISAQSRSAVAAVVRHGYMKGYPDGSFRPAQPITRAEAIALLDRTAAWKLTEAGTYGPVEGAETIRGNVVITSPDVTLQNVRITGDLILAQSIGEGEVTLKGVIVEGASIIRGGGANSIYVIDSALLKVVVDKKTGTVRVVASGTTNIDQVSLESGAMLETNDLTGSGFGEVIISVDDSTGEPVVVLSGDFASVVVEAPNAVIQLRDGTVGELKVSETAANAKVDVAENASVDFLVLDSKAEISGAGTVRKAMVNAEGATFEKEPEELELADNVTIGIGGTERRNEEQAPAEPGGNSGGGGGGNPGSNPGTGPGDNPGDDPGNDPGDDPGDDPGNGPGDDPGDDPGNEPPTIVSVESVDPVEVEYGTSENDALSALPGTIKVTDSEGGEHTVSLNWTIDGYNGTTPGDYTATGTFDLPNGVEQSDPPHSLTVTTTVTVKPGIIPTIYSGGDGLELILEFDVPMAEPENPANGFTVLLNGNPNPVVSTVLDEDTGKIRLGLANPIAVGTVTVSYTPSGLETESGEAVAAFSGVIVPTAGSIAAAMQSEGASATDVFTTLDGQGFWLSVIAKALFVSEYDTDAVITAFKTWVDIPQLAGASLVLAGYPVEDVIAALIREYEADIDAVAFSIVSEAGTAQSLVAYLVQAGFADPAELAEVLSVLQYSVSDAVSALWPAFNAFPGQLGQALLDAGYELPALVEALLAIGGGSNTAAVAGALPGILGDNGTLVAMATAASNLKALDISFDDAVDMLSTLYPSFKNTARFPVLAAGGFEATDIGMLAKAYWEQTLQNADTIVTVTEELHQYAGMPAGEVLVAIRRIYQPDVLTLYDRVLPKLGISNLRSAIEYLKQEGFDDSEIALVAYRRSGNDVEKASPLLNLAGYSADQVTLMMKPHLGGNFNVNRVIGMLSGDMLVSGSYVGNFSAGEILSMVQKHLGASAHTAGLEFLKHDSQYSRYTYAEIAEALIDVYGIDAADFVLIRNNFYRTNNGTLTNELTSSTRCLYCVLKNTFELDALSAVSAVKDLAYSNSKNNLRTAIKNLLENMYGITDDTAKVGLMIEAGYTLEDASILLASTSAPNAQQVSVLREAGYSAEAVAKKLKSYYPASESTVLGRLLDGGYGSCSELETIIRAMRYAYSYDDVQLRAALLTKCGVQDVDSALLLYGDGSFTPLMAVQSVYNSGGSAAQAVSLLADVYGLVDPVEIASLLYQVNNADGIKQLEALRTVSGVSASGAKDVLTSVHGITAGATIANRLQSAGYVLADIIPVLGTNDPLELAGYLEGMRSVYVLDTLVQLFGPEGALNNPLALARQLHALDVEPAEAAVILQRFGYSPAEIGSLLWSNGYEFRHVVSGVLGSLNVSSDQYWPSFVTALKQMATCDGSLGALPTCATGTSTFTDRDVVLALAEAIDRTNLDCREVTATCAQMFVLLKDSGYDLTFISYRLMNDFDLTPELLGRFFYYLAGMNDSYGQSPYQVVTLLSQELFGLGPSDIAKALKGGGYPGHIAHKALYEVLDISNLDALKAMKNGGYEPIEVGKAILFNVSTFRPTIYRTLRDVGYGDNEAYNLVFKVKPITPEEALGWVRSAL